MIGAFQFIGRIAAYAFFGFLIGVLSDSPPITWIASDRSQIKLSFSYGAKGKSDCRQRTVAEMASLEPNMRKPLDCKRERRALYLEVKVDGSVVYTGWLQPSGLSGDGASRIYRIFTVDPGRHRLSFGMRETARSEGFDFQREEEVTLMPQQNFVVDFRSDIGGFIFK
ncbi:MAG: hypothetical protein WCK65_11755 [Rhodospirillaceae bacterium]